MKETTIDYLELIKRLVEQHRTIRSQIRQAGQSISDLEAISDLQKQYEGWVLSSERELAEKKKNLQTSISSMVDGLNKHFEYEEKSLPPLMGDVLMQALLIEHRVLRKEMDRSIQVLSELEVQGFSREELLLRKSRMRQVMDSLYQMIEEHAGKEEMIFSMMQKALEERAKEKAT